MGKMEVMSMDKFMSWMSYELVVFGVQEPSFFQVSLRFCNGLVAFFQARKSSCFFWLFLWLPPNPTVRVFKCFLAYNCKCISVLFGFWCWKKLEICHPPQTSEFQAPERIHNIPAFLPVYDDNLSKNLYPSYTHHQDKILLLFVNCPFAVGQLLFNWLNYDNTRGIIALLVWFFRVC